MFVPFRDGTSGRETYGPGRYLTLELNESDEYELDFNRAFNPYCAYTDAFECGFAPAENDLPVPVRAGEKAWSDARNPKTSSSAITALLPPRPTAKAAPRKAKVAAKTVSRRRPVSRATPKKRAAPRGARTKSSARPKRR